MHVRFGGGLRSVLYETLPGPTLFEQIEGLPAHYLAKPEPRFNPVQRIEHAETFFSSRYPAWRHASLLCAGSGLYPDAPFEAFCDAESYYATLAHESTHWTKHPSRLAREFGRKKWGDKGYAEEELVAEMGAAFLCAALELALQPREDHAA